MKYGTVQHVILFNLVVTFVTILSHVLTNWEFLLQTLILSCSQPAKKSLVETFLTRLPPGPGLLSTQTLARRANRIKCWNSENLLASLNWLLAGGGVCGDVGDDLIMFEEEEREERRDVFLSEWLDTAHLLDHPDHGHQPKLLSSSNIKFTNVHIFESNSWKTKRPSLPSYHR